MQEKCDGGVTVAAEAEMKRRIGEEKRESSKRKRRVKEKRVAVPFSANHSKKVVSRDGRFLKCKRNLYIYCFVKSWKSNVKILESSNVILDQVNIDIYL